VERSHCANETDVVTQLFRFPAKDMFRVQVFHLEYTTGEEK
jgi:hypothetical protein